MGRTIYLPPVIEYRRHLLLVMGFAKAYLAVCSLNGRPDTATEEALDHFLLESLIKRITDAAASGEVKVNDAEVCVIYACLVVMNELLLNDGGEELSAMFLSSLPADHHLKQYSAFRDEMLMLNTHLIQDTDKKLSDTPGLAERKEMLKRLKFG